MITHAKGVARPVLSVLSVLLPYILRYIPAHKSCSRSACPSIGWRGPKWDVTWMGIGIGMDIRRIL